MSEYIKNALYIALGLSLIVPGIQIFKSVTEANNPELQVTFWESFSSSIPHVTAVLVGIILILSGMAVIINIINTD